MKLIKYSLFVLLAAVAGFSCEKETSYEGGATVAAQGSVLKDVSGNCVGAVVNGIYRTNTALNLSNYADVKISITTTGNYLITTDTVNGIYFRSIGSFTNAGINTVRLYGVGTPGSATGPHTMTVTFDSTECSFDVITIAANTAGSIFTLGKDASNNCTGVTVNGVYRSGTTLNASNSITAAVTAATAGTYNLSVATTNGMSFTGSGYFATPGIHSVTLGGFGIPGIASQTVLQLMKPGDTSVRCNFRINVLPAGNSTAASFTVTGAGSACTGATTTGTYSAGTATNGTNTAIISVNVTTIGTYSISSNTVNGVTFLGTGNFTIPGVQPVILTAQGTPTAAGSFNYNITGGSSTCSMSLVVN